MNNLRSGKYPNIEELKSVLRGDAFWVLNDSNEVYVIDTNTTNYSQLIFHYINPNSIYQKTLYPGHYPGMFANYEAFAVLSKDGTVVTWESSSYGGDALKVQDELHDVVKFSPPYVKIK